MKLRKERGRKERERGEREEREERERRERREREKREREKREYVQCTYIYMYTVKGQKHYVISSTCIDSVNKELIKGFFQDFDQKGN